MSGDANEPSASLADRLGVALTDVRSRNRRIRRRLGRAFEGSVLGAGVRGTGRALEHSRLAAWFRQPPDGPVAVDLAESYVAGPLVGLVGPPFRYLATAWQHSTVAEARGPLRRSSEWLSTDAAGSLARDPARVASALALAAIFVLVARRGLPTDPILLASAALLACAALLGVLAGSRASARNSVVGRLLRWLRGVAPKPPGRSR